MDQQPPSAADAAIDAGAGPALRLHYQLTGAVDVDSDADWFVLDLFDTDRAALSELHRRGRKVMAYMSAGSFEPWRPDSDAFPEMTVGNPLERYPAERWVDLRDTTVRELMLARLQLAADKGFDGVFTGSLGAYRADSGFPITREDQIAYDLFLASGCRQLGLSPGLSGDFALADVLADDFEWAIALGCVAADNCSALDPLTARGIPVFDLEVVDDPEPVCAQAATLTFPVIIKRESFDAWSQPC